MLVGAKGVYARDFSVQNASSYGLAMRCRCLEFILEVIIGIGCETKTRYYDLGRHTLVSC